jgi:predicted DNA-binding transcriptional regulator AlpA
MNDQKLYYTIDEVRKIIYANGVSKSTLHNMINSGDIPSRRLMKRVFVPRWWVDKEIAIATHAPQEVN